MEEFPFHARIDRKIVYELIKDDILLKFIFIKAECTE